jgi:hypothetical protein
VFKKCRKVEVLMGCRNRRDAGTAGNHVKDLFLKPIPIYADNNGAIALASNPKFYAATKHIAIRFYKLREVV